MNEIKNLKKNVSFSKKTSASHQDMAISIVIIEVLNTGGNTYGKLKSPQGRHCELHLHTLRLEIMEYKAEKKSVMNLKVSFCVTQPSACRSLEAEGQRIPMHSTSSCLTANEN